MQYYIPGACALALILLPFSKKINLLTYNVYSCIWSYIAIALIATIRSATSVLDFLDDTPIINSLIAFILSAIIGLLISVVLRTNKAKQIMVTVFNETGNSFILEDIIDYQNGSNIKLTLKDKDYYIVGVFRAFDKETDDGWIAVRGYVKYSLDHQIIQSFEGDYNVIFTTRFRDVDTMTVY